MTRWHFRRRASESGKPLTQSIDASAIRREWLCEKSESEINALEITVDGLAVSLGDVFELSIASSEDTQIVIEGELDEVHGLGTLHDQGDFRIVGNAGHGIGSGMTGGTLSVDGDAGDYVGGPYGAHKVGMAGGVIKITGHVGSYAGHRMRRGVILVHGNAGQMLAASAVAGTICVGGHVGQYVAVGMKRGTIVLANSSGLVNQADEMGGTSSNRFSPPMRFDPAFLNLYRDPMFDEITLSLRQLPVFRTRADRTVGGLGEVIFPAGAELAIDV
ncbi:MAG: formylmethanofuran dehydrogenase subunit C [Planctomycetales bacterium]|nr:formylmethanofuran dehydrogenase subunit C [Planctomycetales bacterium]